MEPVFIILIILLVCILAVSLCALYFAVKASKSKNGGSADARIDSLEKTLSREMSASRSENTLVADSIKNRINDMSEKNLTVQHRIVSSLNESLLEMKTANAVQNEKVLRTLTESVDKMTQSNEKKLEEMRATVDEKLTSTLTQRLDSSFKTVSGQLEKLYTSLG